MVERKRNFEVLEYASEAHNSHELGRLVGDCRAVENISPFLNVINPSLDLRSKLDNMY